MSALEFLPSLAFKSSKAILWILISKIFFQILLQISY